VLLYFWPCGKF